MPPDIDFLLARLRAAGLRLCDEAADVIEALRKELLEWKLGSHVVAERVVAPMLRGWPSGDPPALCEHDDPTWCDAECERKRRAFWVWCRLRHRAVDMAPCDANGAPVEGENT